MNSKEIFNIIVELSRMQETELVKHNKSLAEQLSKNDKPSKFNLSKNKR
jgi:enterochelin esterase-like enzyme